MKQITVLVPTYNEEGNIEKLYNRTKKIFNEQLSSYVCKILFVDNCSTDNTRNLIENLCDKDNTVMAIFNLKNFGFARSQFNGLQNAPGDAVILMYADCQDPPEVIPEFVKKWEAGANVVCGVKKRSKENLIMFLIRKAYYKLIKKISDINHINQFDGFGLYDKSFIRILSSINDKNPYFRGIVAEYGKNIQEVVYEQGKRTAGKSSFNLLSYYDFAMLGITSYSKRIIHFCTIMGAVLSVISIVIAIITFIKKIQNWDSFPVGSAAMQIGIFFLGAIQIFFIGFIGEYLVNMNTRIMNHPLVIEEKRINF